MKGLLKRIIQMTVANDTAWSVLAKTLLPVAYYAEMSRQKLRSQPVNYCGPALGLVKEPIVRNGPFAGMRYATAEAAGSELLPKLLGSYESELHVLFERVLASQPDVVVDIGCAEGYYAIGIARRLPRADVHAFDIDPRARQLCTEMASLNGVAERVHCRGRFEADVLRQIGSSQRVFVLSDCEGHEREIFDPDTVALLRSHEVLIEVHDFLDPEISQRLRDVFSSTHDLEVFRSVDDLEKTLTYDFPETRGLTRIERLTLMRERRPCIMEWYFFSPKPCAHGDRVHA